MVPFPLSLSDPKPGFQGHRVIVDALDVLCAQLTRDLFAIAKFLFLFTIGRQSVINDASDEWCKLFRRVFVPKDDILNIFMRMFTFLRSDLLEISNKGVYF